MTPQPFELAGCKSFPANKKPPGVEGRALVINALNIEPLSSGENDCLEVGRFTIR